MAPRGHSRRTGPGWSTQFGLDSALVRWLAIALVALTIAGFAFAAMTALGVLPTAIWPAAIAIGSVASLGLLAVCFHPWLMLGVVIDVALLWSCLVVGWQPGVNGLGA